jgi:hypothetical protein
MCARRFLILVLILILLVVAGAFALFQFGDRVLIKQATPVGHYQEPPKASGPDYPQLDAWIARPEIGKNPSQWMPETYVGGDDRYLGYPPPPVRMAAFYIHPTTYLERSQWNAPVDEPQSRARAELFVRSQASAFSDTAQVWAPRYRQAAYGAFLLSSKDSKSALDLAYSDISRAFDEFLKQVPSDEPLILAGHSQGALHLMRLIEERKGELKGRLVAAYIVGWPVSTKADLPSLGFPPCRAPDQTGCILSWMSFAEPANPSLIFGEWEKTRGRTGLGRDRSDILCVNPVTGVEGDTAPPLDNPGTLVPDAGFASAKLLPGTVGAHCDKGLLLLDGEIPDLGRFVLPGNNYHVYDYALFWGAVAQDAMRRAIAWR